MKVHRIVGVYHAEGSLLGELRYLVGKWRGTTSCALCDITHGALAEKAAFRACRGRFVVPIETLHLDEQDGALRAFTAGKTACVVALIEGRWTMLLDRTKLEQCQGSVERFSDALSRALGEVQLS